MKILFRFLLILLTSSILIESLKVSVYYETLCRDSVRFVTRQLYPAYNSVKDHLQIEFIPYGKAIHNLINKKWQFECQHGNNECIGNKYHSCVLNETDNQDKQVAFVYCAMKSPNSAAIQNIRICAIREGFDWRNITECAASSVGDQLLADNGDKTPSLSFVPTVIFDDQYDAIIQDRSLDDFTGVICRKIHQNKPEICNNNKQ